MNLTTTLNAEGPDTCAANEELSPSRRRRKIRPGVLLGLLGLSMVILLARLHTYNEPLERDITTYALIAHQLIEGKTLYSDLWDHKPPAIHITYAIAECIAGYGRGSILLMNVAAAIATMVGCYFAGSRISGKPFGGLLAAAGWAITGGDMGLEANQPNTEVFLNAFLVSGFALFVMASSRPTLGPKRTVIVGMLFALASLYKQIVIVQAALLCLVYLLSAGRTDRKRAFGDVIVISTIGAFAWGFAFAYFSFTGRINDFVDCVFTYNRVYAGNFFSNLAHGLTKPPIPTGTLILMSLMGVATIVGAGIGFFRGSRRLWSFLMIWTVATHISVLLTGQFFAHYYQLWLPPLIIGTAWAVELLTANLRAQRGWVCAAIAVATVGILLLFEVPHYLLPAQKWSERKYGSIFVEADGIAHKLAKALRPEETFYEWGNETGLYFTSRHDPPSGIFFADPLIISPTRDQLWKRVARDLERTKPDVVVLEMNTVGRTPTSHPIFRWVKANYRAIWKDPIFFVVARKGSRIECKYRVKADAALTPNGQKAQ